MIKELVETEHNYVEVINKLKKNFMRPLQAILSQSEHDIIFCKITASFLNRNVLLLIIKTIVCFLGIT